jgi:K+-sensing histidine kinase KdpD
VRRSPSIPIGSRRSATATPSWRGTAAVVLIALGSLAITTLSVAVLEGDVVGIDDASPVFLVAVVAVGAVAGTAPAVATAVAAFLTYDHLITNPRLSLVVADPRGWLDLDPDAYPETAVDRT